MPFGAELIMSNRKMFRYEWIWQKNLAVGFLNANKMPLRIHENILVFYQKLPVYNPQFSEGKPYKKFHSGKDSTTNYKNRDDWYIENPGIRYPRDILYYGTPFTNQRKGEPCYHPTQKPVDLLEYLIKTYTNEGETVLDNCIGSGSTAVACVNTNRNFIGFETEMKYCEISRKRIEEAQKNKQSTEVGLLF